MHIISVFEYNDRSILYTIINCCRWVYTVSIFMHFSGVIYIKIRHTNCDHHVEISVFSYHLSWFYI